MNLFFCYGDWKPGETQKKRKKRPETKVLIIWGEGSLKRPTRRRRRRPRDDDERTNKKGPARRKCDELAPAVMKFTATCRRTDTHLNQKGRAASVARSLSLSLWWKKGFNNFFFDEKKENTFDETSWLYGARYSQWRQENSPLLFLETVSRDLTQMKHEIEKKQQFRASHSN